MGIIVAQSAVYDFSLGHNVKNRASGVLDQDTVVTTSEMQEHVYYQVLNLVQICYLHFIDSNWSFFNRRTHRWHDSNEVKGERGGESAT